MKNRISLHRPIDENQVRINEVKSFWRLSSRVSELRKGGLEDKTYMELAELRDEIDLIAEMSDRQEMRDKARKRVADIDAWLIRAKDAVA